LYLVLPLVQAFFGLILLPIVLKGHLRNAAHRLFSFYLGLLAVYGVLIFLMRSSPTTDQALFWDKWAAAVGPLSAVVLFHFSLRFSGFTISKWILYSAYCVSIVIFILTNTDLVMSDMQIKSYGYAPVGGPLFFLVAVFGFMFYISAARNFWKIFRTAPYAEERNRSAYVFTGMVISMMGAALDVLPMVGLPLYPGLIIGNLIFCGLTTVAIVKYRLLDIRLIARKGVAYLLISTLVATPYVGIILILNHVLERTTPLWVDVLLLAVLAISLQPVWWRLQRMVDRWFYRETFDHLIALEKFSQEAHKISDFKYLGPSLVGLISQALRTSYVYLFLDMGNGSFANVASATGKPLKSTLERATPLINWLRDNKKLLHRRDLAIIPQLQSFTLKDSKILNGAQAEAFVPILTKENELLGLLVLGEKLSQQPYSQEDEHLVMAVADRTAVELENVRLYESEKSLRAELEKQDKLKTEFLHSVAHELKTPLTAILSSSELLGEKTPIPSALKERLVNNVLQGAESMNRRVAELLDLARTEIGELRIVMKPTDVGKVLSHAAWQLKILFQVKEQALSLEIPGKLPKVNADKEKLEQVLFNLLSNANKFSPTGSNVILRAKKMDKRIVVEVEDSAPRLNERERAKIFNSYYRGEDAEQRQRSSGLGLGLSISKKLIEEHKGEIWVESKPRIGNVFAFSLPVSD
jgi:signal transduction histidine kinase